MTDLPRLTAALADRYRIERELGAGGMATVYLAVDLKHDRKVALKVLKPELAAVLGADRFVREIKTTAALQHPHILPLFDSGEADGFLYYVMPFIDGETLRTKLDRETQLAVDDAVKVATTVADALDYAHRHGVIHRDIKPENILLNDGTPMVADFGIALAVSAAAGGRMTETGMSLGTPSYMSPEQATAEKEITGRSDVYSLASVLFETLTGSPPHIGATAQQVVMKVIAEPAAPLMTLRHSVPPHVAAAVAKALEKLPADRFASAKAFADALTNPAFAPVLTRGVAAPPSLTGRLWWRDPRSWAALLLAVGSLASAALLARRAKQPPSTSAMVVRATIVGLADSTFVAMTPLGGTVIDRPVVAPNGRVMAFPVFKSSGTVVYLRELADTGFTQLPGNGPFFSPNSVALAFFRGSELWTHTLTESVSSRLGTIPEIAYDIRAALWHADGRIFIGGTRGLWTIPSTGGDPTLLLPADALGGGEVRDLAALPDGRILVTVRTLPETEARGFLFVMTPDAATRIRIMPGAETGWILDDILVYAQSGQYRATHIDLKRLQPIGRPIALPDPVARRLAPSIAWSAAESESRLEPVWVTRDGQATPVGLTGTSFGTPRVSRDGRRLAIYNGTPGVRSMQLLGLGRGTRAAIAYGPYAVWSFDERSLFLSTGQRPYGGIQVQRADGSESLDTLLRLADADAWPTSARADGSWLAYEGASLGSGSNGDAADPMDIFFLDLRTRQSRRIRLPGAQRDARFSPDGQWVAYQSTETGRWQVHVRPWPAMDANYQISSDGGTEPTWSYDGRRLYFRHESEVMESAIAVRDGVIDSSNPRALFTGTYAYDPVGDWSYDVAPDDRFLMLRPEKGRRVQVEIALNWIAGVRARLEAAR